MSLAQQMSHATRAAVTPNLIQPKNQSHFTQMFVSSFCITLQAMSWKMGKTANTPSTIAGGRKVVRSIGEEASEITSPIEIKAKGRYIHLMKPLRVEKTAQYSTALPQHLRNATNTNASSSTPVKITPKDKANPLLHTKSPVVQKVSIFLSKATIAVVRLTAKALPIDSPKRYAICRNYSPLQYCLKKTGKRGAMESPTIEKTMAAGEQQSLMKVIAVNESSIIIFYCVRRTPRLYLQNRITFLVMVVWRVSNYKAILFQLVISEPLHKTSNMASYNAKIIYPQNHLLKQIQLHLILEILFWFDSLKLKSCFLGAHERKVEARMLDLQYRFQIWNKKQQMDIPLGNIFEVTINSNRLYSYIEDIQTQLNQHADKINSLNLSMSTISSSLKEQIVSKDYNIDIQLEKMRKASQEQVNYVRLFMRDVDKKATDKIGELETNVNFLSNKLVKVKETIEDDLTAKLSYFDKRLNSISTLQEDQERSKQEIVQLRETLSETNYTIQKMAVGSERENKKNKEITDQLLERISQIERQLKNESEQIHSMKHSMVDSHLQRGKRRNREKRDSQLFANIINKIDEVQHSFTRDHHQQELSLHNPRRSFISHSKVVKSNANINQVPKSNFAVKTVGKFKQFENLVMQKLAKLQALSLQKFEQFQKQLAKLQNKSDIIDEYIGILSRKIDKQKFKISEVAENMKRYDDKRIDQKTIQSLKNMIKKLSKDTEQMLDSKVNKEIYQKEKLKSTQKMQFLNEFMIQKAEKAEVKKGLAFLQEKIKEIIIVLAEQRGSTQDGALKRVPYKCLSCDKDLEIDRSQAQPRLTPKENVANIARCSTNQLRKKIRMFNNTITTNQNDQ